METDERNANPAPKIPPVLSSASLPGLSALSGIEALRLARGFDFLFVGGLATIAAVAEMMMAPFARTFPLLIAAGGLVFLMAGARQLRRSASLGPAWETRARWLWRSALCAGYLFPFFCAWRNLSPNVYFTGHAMVFFGAILAMMMLLAWLVGALARAAGKAMLLWQARLAIGAALLVQVPPFLTVAWLMMESAGRGNDPLVFLQALFFHLRLFWVSLWLLPFTLTLSLAWESKEFVMEQAVERKP